MLSSLFNLIMMNDLFNSMEVYEDREVESGCMTFILMVVGVIIFIKIGIYIEENFTEYLKYFIILCAFFTIIIPIISMSSKGIDRLLSSILRLTNALVGFMTMLILLNKYNPPLISTIVEYMISKLEPIISHSFVLGLLVGIPIIILQVVTVTMDMVLIPLFTIPFIQRAIWFIIDVFRR